MVRCFRASSAWDGSEAIVAGGDRPFGVGYPSSDDLFCFAVGLGAVDIPAPTGLGASRLWTVKRSVT